MKKGLLVLSFLLNIFSIYAQEKPVQVTLDRYFNHEWRKTADGNTEWFHYIWEETDNQGYSLFGKMFTDQGATLFSLMEAPTKKNRKNSDIYIIVDPDNLRDCEHPNPIDQKHIKAIKYWVSKGGVLVLMGNDSVNCDLAGLNRLANNFGINFSNRSRNMVQNNEFQTGAVALTNANEIFKTSKKAYLKEISILEVNQPAKAIVTMGNDVIMAVSRYGKGTVFVVGDPWLYNEYVDGKKIPAEFENMKAGRELVDWLIQQTEK